MRRYQFVFAFGLLFLICCKIENNNNEFIKQIFIGLPIDTLIENEDKYNVLFDTVFYEHIKFEIKANEYRISTFIEESIDEGKTNLLIRLDAKYSKNETINTEKQYLKFIHRNLFNAKRIEDYKSHTNTGLITGKAYFKEKNDYSPYLLITLLKDTSENYISFVYCKNIK